MPLTEEEVTKLQADLEAEKAKSAAAEAKIKELSTKKTEDPPPPPDDPSLNEKVRKEREAKEGKAKDIKQLERAIEFNLSASHYVKENKDILPSECEELVKAAEGEKYDSAIEKSSAIKSAIIQSFFQVQANVDLLTASQKKSLEDYLKLTKNGKEEKADHVFENIFEPTLESFKRVRKAEDMNKSRFGTSSGNKLEQDYKERLMKGSRKTYLGEK